MLGPWASDLTITLASNYDGLLLAILPPGAFMALAVIIALKNKIDRVQQRRSANAVSVAVPLQSSRA
jgi:electron transport complex protein RnfE